MTPLKLGKHKNNYTHPKHPRYISHENIVHKKAFDGTIKVVTYNIKLSKKTAKALDLLSDHRELRDADILCLQEMDPHGVKLIADSLKYNYVYYPAILHPRSSKDFGNAILAKWPIVHDEKIILPKLGPGKLQRIAVHATVLINAIEVSIICVHMKIFANRDQRQIPIKKIINKIKPSIKYSIIAGDFNTFSKSNCRAIFEPFEKSDFKIVTSGVGATYKYWYLLNKSSSLDHIFTRGMNVISAGKVSNRKPSDHIPVWGRLKLEIKKARH